MPVVEVRYARRVADDLAFGSIARGIVTAVVEHLSCEDEGGQLERRDIAVFFIKCGNYDVTPYDVDIKITAKLFPSRATDIQERSQRIWNDLERRMDIMEIGTATFCVYTVLSEAGFVDSPEVALTR